MEESVDRLVYECESYYSLAFKKMAEFRNREEFTDIILVAGCKKIPAHKVIISSLCSYFSAMFRNELSESQQQVVTINNVDPDALEALINYAYTSKIEIRVDNVENILASACLLQVTDVRDACCTFMKSQLHPSNCLGIRAFADAHACEQLFDIANSYVKDNFGDVARNQEFLLLNSEQLVEILQSDELNVLKEDDVFHALSLWVNHNPDSRKNQLHKVLPAVRLALLSPQFLIDEIEPMIQCDEKCKDLFIETMKHHLLPDRSSRNSMLSVKARKGTIGVIYAVGGIDEVKGAATGIEEYNPRKNVWSLAASMETKRLQFGVAVVSNKLYVIGGRDGLMTLNNVERFDPKSNKWETMTSMLTHRHGLGVAVLCGPLYAVGGHDGWSYLNTVERFDPQTSKWCFVKEMNTPRSTVGVAVLDNKLYAVGGRDGSSCLNSVEVYDPHTDKWKIAAPMVKRRGGVGVAVLRGFLYAAGGHDAPASCESSKQFSSVERYDPRSDQWSLIASMNNCRDAVGMTALGDHLYSVGGYDGQAYLDAVESYDPDSNKWVDVGKLAHPRAGACVVALKFN
ncbi:kelch-like protein 5 [Hydra vulgaris]|uniref:kelch-like protein 5 n=1 Tax=Hydra vulgaris TaxID=6087 RepID=UPI0002B43F2E|nr:kelch-like protein 5 [Hydra vulgaris]XP_012554731.1 kelch-like protein 5 [Hydra vulgaris]XP_047126390.1 kelch-like protein 5 [Hydra vulgaris]